MSKTDEQLLEEERRKRAERQWIDQYKHYSRLIAKAKAELSAE